nr:hypothetical protein [Acrocarpospora corrugata]
MDLAVEVEVEDAGAVDEEADLVVVVGVFGQESGAGRTAPTPACTATAC